MIFTTMYTEKFRKKAKKKRKLSQLKKILLALY